MSFSESFQHINDVAAILRVVVQDGHQRAAHWKGVLFVPAAALFIFRAVFLATSDTFFARNTELVAQMQSQESAVKEAKRAELQ